MKNINERLAEERKRLGLNKGQMAAAGGVANSTYGNYEDGLREPTSAFYMEIHKAGADINYIITGHRSASITYQTGGMATPHIAQQQQLSAREYALLDNYRAASEEGKRAVEAASAALSQSPKKKA